MANVLDWSFLTVLLLSLKVELQYVCKICCDRHCFFGFVVLRYLANASRGVGCYRITFLLFNTFFVTLFVLILGF